MHLRETLTYIFINYFQSNNNKFSNKLMSYIYFEAVDYNFNAEKKSALYVKKKTFMLEKAFRDK